MTKAAATRKDNELLRYARVIHDDRLQKRARLGLTRLQRFTESFSRFYRWLAIEIHEVK